MLTHLLQTFHGLTAAQPWIFGLQQKGDVPQLPPRPRLLFAVPVQVGPRQALQLLQTIAVGTVGCFKTEQIHHEGS